MFDSVTIVIIFALLIGLGGLALWITRQSLGLGEIKLFHSKARRLGLVESTSLDGRRRLVLVRRDDVEHLIMTGGPVDVLIETNIPAAARVPNGYGEPLIRPDAGNGLHRPLGAEDVPLSLQREHQTS